jgi:hypothetical protein
MRLKVRTGAPRIPATSGAVAATVSIGGRALTLRLFMRTSVLLRMTCSRASSAPGPATSPPSAGSFNVPSLALPERRP